MECIVLAGNEAQRTRWLYQLEDLGPEWRCIPLGRAEQALRCMSARYVPLAIVDAGAESRTLLHQLQRCPLLSPPWLLGDGLMGPDGAAPSPQELPGLLRSWRQDGLLPALSQRRLPEAAHLARGLLHALEIPCGMRAWAFLPDMAALTAVHPPLLTDLQHGLYPLTGRRHGMTAPAVERSLRLCVEATWNRGSLPALERFFGHSVDPERGKPTNREFLCRVQERLVLSAGRLERIRP